MLIVLAPRDGLFGASRLTLRVALAGDRRRCAASSNRLFVCRRFELAPTSRGSGSAYFGIFEKIGSPGRIRNQAKTTWNLSDF